jgi:hypothetical protein
MSNDCWYNALLNFSKISISDEGKNQVLKKFVKDSNNDSSSRRLLKIFLSGNNLFVSNDKQDVYDILGSLANVNLLAYIYDNFSSFMSFHDFTFLIIIKFDRQDFLKFSHEQFNELGKKSSRRKTFHYHFSKLIKGVSENMDTDNDICESIGGYLAIDILNSVDENLLDENRIFVIENMIGSGDTVDIVGASEEKIEKVKKVKNYIVNHLKDKDDKYYSHHCFPERSFQSLQVFIIFFNHIFFQRSNISLVTTISSGKRKSDGDSDDSGDNRKELIKKICSSQNNYAIIQWLLKESSLKEEIFVSYFDIEEVSENIENIENIELFKLFLSSAKTIDDFSLIKDILQNLVITFPEGEKKEVILKTDKFFFRTLLRNKNLEKILKERFQEKFKEKFPERSVQETKLFEKLLRTNELIDQHFQLLSNYIPCKSVVDLILNFF